MEAVGELTLGELRASSSIFRILSEPLLECLLRRMETRRFQPGEAVHFSEGLLLLRHGRALWDDDDHGERPLCRGAVFGEARLLGLDVEPKAAPVGAMLLPRAEGNPVVAAVLRRRDFKQALVDEGSEEDHRVLAGFAPEAIPDCQGATTGGLWRKLFLRRPRLFQESGSNFLQLLSTYGEDVFLAPGESLPSQHEKPALYVVVAGIVHIEGKGGALLRIAKAFDSFGEAQALDLEGYNSLDARAGDDRLVFVLRFPKEAVLAALHVHPEDHLPLEELAHEFESHRGQAEADRYQWISNRAGPALGRSPLLAGCPDDFLRSIAGYASEVKLDTGSKITTAGETAAHMFMVLDGMVDLQSRSGASIGQIGPGGTLGEVEALGMFCTSTVTAVAGGPCSVLKVSSDVFQRALHGPRGRLLRQGFDKLIATRHEQVNKGLPLTGLKISAQPDDLAVRTVALQSERLPLEAKEIWRPLPDSDPSGPRIGILVRGRAVVELVASGREVMSLVAGSIVCEGVLAEFGAHVRAVSSDCEAYRIRTVELLAAAQMEAKSPAWFYEFRLMEREAADRLRTKLTNARGLLDGKVVHACDPCIRDWTVRRQQSIKRAQENRAARAEVIGEGKGSLPQLPLLPPEKFGTTAFRSWEKVKLPPPIYASSVKRSIVPRGLKSYPCMRLPKISSEPSLRGREGKRAPSESSRRCAGGSERERGPEGNCDTWELR